MREDLRDGVQGALGEVGVDEPRMGGAIQELDGPKCGERREIGRLP